MRRSRALSPVYDDLERLAAPVGVVPADPTLLPVGTPTVLPLAQPIGVTITPGGTVIVNYNL